MGDDLDDLLDEIESKMGKKARKQTPFDQGDGLKSTLISSKQKVKLLWLRCIFDFFSGFKTGNWA